MRATGGADETYSEHESYVSDQTRESVNSLLDAGIGLYAKSDLR